MRLSRRGMLQARSPRSASTAGTSVMRTMNASTKTPTASPSAITLMLGSPSGTKAANTANMMSAAAVTTFALPTNPRRIAVCASAPCTYSSRMRETRKTS